MFIDFVGAFSNLPRQFAIEALQKKEVLNKNGMMIQKFLYQETVVKMGSKTVKLTKGVPMGFQSSPAIFAISLEPLLEMLDKEGLISLLYCDDQAIIGTPSQLLRAQKILEEFCNISKFKISNPKSGVVKLARLNVKQDNHKLWEPIPWQESYKYLGTLVTRANNLDAQLRVTRRKIFTVLSRVKQVSNEMSLHKRRLLFKSLVLPHIDAQGPIAMIMKKPDPKYILKKGKYTKPVVTEVEKLFVLTRRAIRIIMGLGRNVDNKFVDLFFSYDRRILWKARLLKVLDNWKTKGLSWNNQWLNETIAEELPVTEKEIELKLWGDEIITVLNLFYRGIDEEDRRLSETRLKYLGIYLNKFDIIKAIRENNIIKIKEIKNTLCKFIKN